MRNLSKLRAVFTIFFIVINLYALNAQSASETDDPLLFEAEPDLFGLTLSLGYKGLSFFPEVDTIFKVSAGGNYSSFSFYRTPTDEPYNGLLPGYDAEKSPEYTRASFQFSCGIAQGLLWNDMETNNLLELFVDYKLSYYHNFKDKNTNQLISDSMLPDRETQLQNSILVGLEWNDMDTSQKHNILSGSTANISLEYGPEWFFNSALGKSDFLRFNFQACAFLPLFDLSPESDLNILSSYLGIFFDFDYAWGEYIPIDVRSTFGGKCPRDGLGYAVRGLEDGRFDTPLKLVANIELRTNLPALGLPDIIPGIIVFIDSGYYNFIDYSESGFVFSTGFGLYLSLFNTVNLNFYTTFLLNKETINGETWIPFSFDFMFHF
jgi:hypothetical protein